MNKTKISNPKSSSINCIDTVPNPLSNNILVLAYAGANIHLAKQMTTTTSPVIISNEIIARLLYGSTMDSSQITTIQLSGISNQARKNQILPKMKISPLISLEVLCDDGLPITQDKQEISVHKNGKEIIKGTRNKKTGMWEVPLDTQQPEAAINSILAQTSKPELAQYLHAEILRPTTASLIKAIKQGFLKTWPGLTRKLIKRHLEKSRSTTMAHLQMRRQGIKSYKENLLIQTCKRGAKQI